MKQSRKEGGRRGDSSARTEESGERSVSGSWEMMEEVLGEDVIGHHHYLRAGDRILMERQRRRRKI